MAATAGRLRTDDASPPAVAAPRSKPTGPASSWSTVAHHVARAVATIPLGDVEAAAAGAGAFALWALALSLLVA
jgi:hypothetical protein